MHSYIGGRPQEAWRRSLARQRRTGSRQQRNRYHPMPNGVHLHTALRVSSLFAPTLIMIRCVHCVYPSTGPSNKQELLRLRRPVTAVEVTLSFLQLGYRYKTVCWGWVPPTATFDAALQLPPAHSARCRTQAPHCTQQFNVKRTTQAVQCALTNNSMWDAASSS